MEPKTIVVPVANFDLSLEALTYVGQLSMNMPVQVFVLHLLDPKQFKDKKAFQDKLNQLVELKIRPRLERVKATNPELKKIHLETRGISESITDHILDFAKEKKADYIVMGEHGLPPKDRWEKHLEDTTSYEVVLASRCPVFSFTQVPKPQPPKHIVLPLDLSEGSKLKVAYAIDLARRFSAKITLISAYKPTEPANRTKLETLQEEVAAQLGAEGLLVNRIVQKGLSLADVTLQNLEAIGADLVIIMSRPSNRFGDLWVAPGVKRIISFSKVPVLSLRLKSWITEL